MLQMQTTRLIIRTITHIIRPKCRLQDRIFVQMKNKFKNRIYQNLITMPCRNTYFIAL